MNKARYFCRGCGQEVKDADETCPNCKGNLKEVGRNITLVLTETLQLSESLDIGLTKEERSTLEKIISWVRERINVLELSELELGFPSGIRIKLVKRQKG